MSVIAKLISQDGERLSRLDGVPLNPLIRAAGALSLPLLASADVYDDTFFNEKQVSILRQELAVLLDVSDQVTQSTASSLNEYLESMPRGEHAQLVFVGD